MEEKPFISFIIVNYRSERYLERCLTSIFKNAKNIEKEIIIVSIHDTPTVPTGIRLISIPENNGLGNACNSGAKEAKGTILCFLNPDTELLADIEPVIDCFRNEKIGICGPRLIGGNGKTQEWCAGKKINLCDIIGNNVGFKQSKKIWESNKSVSCAWVSGACLCIRKTLFDTLNGFDENFFMYFEDVDLCMRTIKAGYRVMYLPRLIVKHFGGKSFESKKEQKNFYYRSQDYYFLKHFGKISANLLKLIRRATITN